MITNMLARDNMDNLITTINELLDTTKKRLELSSDAALAKFIDVAPMTIARWRKGKYLGKSGRFFVSMIVGNPSLSESETVK
jgi:hypothetical protein